MAADLHAAVGAFRVAVVTVREQTAQALADLTAIASDPAAAGAGERLRELEARLRGIEATLQTFRTEA
jgi:hypothetical protein